MSYVYDNYHTVPRPPTEYKWEITKHDYVVPVSEYGIDPKDKEKIDKLSPSLRLPKFQQLVRKSKDMIGNTPKTGDYDFNDFGRHFIKMNDLGAITINSQTAMATHEVVQFAYLEFFIESSVASLMFNLLNSLKKYIVECSRIVLLPNATEDSATPSASLNATEDSATPSVRKQVITNVKPLYPRFAQRERVGLTWYGDNQSKQEPYVMTGAETTYPLFFGLAETDFRKDRNTLHLQDNYFLSRYYVQFFVLSRDHTNSIFDDVLKALFIVKRASAQKKKNQL